MPAGTGTAATLSPPARHRDQTVVQKYGGSSLGDVAAVRRCAERAAATRREGTSLVVVVSAMGRTTDALLATARALDESPEPRLLDRLLATGETASCSLMTLALRAEGVDAVALSGADAGIVTDGVHGRAMIREVDVRRLRFELARGRVAVVAGYQGCGPDGAITTLGRGGSDATAVALAAALGAARCEILTDVDGVFTADPRLVPEADHLAYVEYDDMEELAAHGAGVVQTRAVELARAGAVPLHVAHSDPGRPGRRARGTRIGEDVAGAPICGCALRRGLTRLTAGGLPASAVSDVCARLAALGADIDEVRPEGAHLVASAPGAPAMQVTATVDDEEATHVANELASAPEVSAVHVESSLAQVAVVGSRVAGAAEVTAAVASALAGRDIALAHLVAGRRSLRCLVSDDVADEALRAIHDRLGLAVETPAAQAVPA
ncbi:MAG: aspartate kinase [Planctomycetota bacterium]